MCMANVLPKDKQIAVIGALAEGSSIRLTDAVRAAILQDYTNATAEEA